MSSRPSRRGTPPPSHTSAVAGGPKAPPPPLADGLGALRGSKLRRTPAEEIQVGVGGAGQWVDGDDGGGSSAPALGEADHAELGGAVGGMRAAPHPAWRTSDDAPPDPARRRRRRRAQEIGAFQIRVKHKSQPLRQLRTGPGPRPAAPGRWRQDVSAEGFQRLLIAVDVIAERRPRCGERATPAARTSSPPPRGAPEGGRMGPRPGAGWARCRWDEVPPSAAKRGRGAAEAPSPPLTVSWRPCRQSAL